MFNGFKGFNLLLNVTFELWKFSLCSSFIHWFIHWFIHSVIQIIQIIQVILSFDLLVSISFYFILIWFEFFELKQIQLNNWTFELTTHQRIQLLILFTQHNNKVKAIWLIHSSLTFQLIHFNILTLKQVNFTSQLYFVFFILLFKQFSSFFHFVAFIHWFINFLLGFSWIKQTNQLNAILFHMQNPNAKISSLKSPCNMLIL